MDPLSSLVARSKSRQKIKRNDQWNKFGKYVTSFSSISYCSNSEYWCQKCIQKHDIHSIILDVHVLKVERPKIPSLSGLRKLN